MLLLEKTTFVIFVLNELQKVFSMFVNVQKVNTILKRVIECPVIERACNKVLWSSRLVVYSPTARKMHPRSNHFVCSHAVSKYPEFKHSDQLEKDSFSGNAKTHSES